MKPTEIKANEILKKILTILLICLLSMAFYACAKPQVTPPEPTLVEATGAVEGLGSPTESALPKFEGEEEKPEEGGIKEPVIVGPSAETEWSEIIWSELPEHIPVQDASYLKASELVINGITKGTTREELIEKLGQPLKIEADDSANLPVFYEYADATYLFEEDSNTVTMINIYGKTDQTTRNIQVGDSFIDTLNKFLREKDYRTSANNAFYGTVSHGNINFGWVAYSGDYGKPTIVIVSEEYSYCFMKIHFKNNAVSFIQVFFTLG